MKKVFILLLAICPLWALGQDQAINDILQQVEQNNLSLQALRRNHRATILESKTANRPSGPSIEYSPFFQKGYTGTAESELIITQEVDFPTRYLDRKRQSQLDANLLDRQYATARRNTLFQAELLCIDLIKNNKTIELERQLSELNDSLLALAEKQQQAGNATVLEINSAQMNYMEAQNRLVKAENNRRIVLTSLTELNGGMSLQDVSLTDFPSLPTLPSYESLRKDLLQNTDVAEAKAELDALIHQTQQTKREWLPALSVGYRRNSNYKEPIHGILVGASFPLYTIGNKVKSARMRQEAAEFSLRAVELSNDAQLLSLYNQLVALQQSLATLDPNIYQQQLTLLQRGLELHHISITDYLTQTSIIYSKLLSYTEQQAELASLSIQLKYLVR